MMEKGIEVGKVRNYYSKISVAVVDLTAPLTKGDKIRIKGDTTDFEQQVDSMQIEHTDIQKAEAGQAVGLRVSGKVRPGDKVYK